MNLQQINYLENNFPRSFSNVIERPWGLLFYNLENPESHDSNHAVILTESTDLVQVIAEIVSFYEAQGLVPRVYQAFIPGEKERLFPVLRGHGFQLGEWDNGFFVHEKPSCIIPNPVLQVRRVYTIDQPIMDLIHTEDEGDWDIKVLQRQVLRPEFHLFAGYLDSTPVAIAAMDVMDGYTRLDHVITHSAYRGQGFARTIVHSLMQLHSSISTNLLYLYSVSPTATRIYEEAGCVRKDVYWEHWSAWKEK